MSYLIVRRGPEQGKIFLVEGDEVTLGRGTKNDIVIDDNEVSRDHLRLTKVMGGYELHDLNSSNGTYVNGQLVEGIWLLRSRCIIELGDSITMEYRLGEPDKDTGTNRAIAEAEAGKAPKFYLVVTTANNEDTTIYPLQGNVITVGRSTANDIVIVEPELSRVHFQLTLTPDGYLIEDQGSTNGTNVNGESLDKGRVLYVDDVITVGTQVQFQVTKSSDNFTPVKTGPLNLMGTAPLNKPKTSLSEFATLANLMQDPTDAKRRTDVGTGVDNISLEKQILITYAREDWEKIVAPLVNNLYSESIDAWVDQYLLEGSSDWLIATEQARLECWLLVVVVSPKAMGSNLVQKNWRHFQNREKPIVLFIHEPVERMPIGARKLTRIQYNPGLPEIAFQQLAAEIKRRKEQQS